MPDRETRELAELLHRNPEMMEYFMSDLTLEAFETEYPTLTVAERRELLDGMLESRRKMGLLRD